MVGVFISMHFVEFSHDNFLHIVGAHSIKIFEWRFWT